MHTNQNYQLLVSRHQYVSPVKLELSRLFRHTMTLGENLLWSYLRRKQIAGLRFRRQQVILGFIVDFYCPALHLAIEVDGEIHGKQGDYDCNRTKLFNEYGITILRFSNVDVFGEIEYVLRTIRDVVESEK